MTARWKRALCITPFKIWACPAREPLTFAEAIWRGVEQIQLRMAQSDFAHAEEFDGGFPKLLIDHFGFSLQLKRGGWSVASAEKAAYVFRPEDLQIIRLICAAIPR